MPHIMRLVRVLASVSLLWATATTVWVVIVVEAIEQQRVPADNSGGSSSSSVTSETKSRSMLNGDGAKYHQKIQVPWSLSSSNTQNNTMSDRERSFRRMEHLKALAESEKRSRKKRLKERRERSRRVLAKMPPPSREQLELVPKGQLSRLREWNDNRFNLTESTRTMRTTTESSSQRRERELWFSSSSGSDSAAFLADAGQEYDKWAQAYRMLGGFIDCDHDKDDDDHHSGDDENQWYSNPYGCSRWMMWASYINPNYQGMEYYEYYSDDAVGKLDCHDPNTEWELVGVYRQEFYQFIEQISKHLWAIDEYEYVVALAGLSYMTDADCFQVGQDSSGNAVYAGVAMKANGKFEMALYTDTYCLQPDTSLGMTLDDYGWYTQIDLGSKDETDDDSYDWASEWWSDTQEYTLTQLNEVYQEYTYCTSCVDYPTYQDGYFIGDYGTDDDDLINQCWKFYSHDSYTCEADCISMAHAQGGILSIRYGDQTFGYTPSSFYQNAPSQSSSAEASAVSSEEGSSSSSATSLLTSAESPMSRLLANCFLILSFMLFVATFLAFVVARRSRYRESRSARSRRLLDDDDKVSRKSRRSKSRSGGSRAGKGGGSEGDGLFRKSSRSKSRSKSSSRKARSSSKDRSRKSSSKRSKSYDPPKPHSSSKDTSGGGEEYF